MDKYFYKIMVKLWVDAMEDSVELPYDLAIPLLGI